MKIAIVEPYFIDSHKQWAEGIKQNSSHEVTLFSLSGHNWKWRMHGGAVSLAQLFVDSEENFDLVVASDMLDLSSFMAHARKRLKNTPVVLYFHENQITYPWSGKPSDYDRHYGFINVNSAIVADCVLFNSQFHKHAFCDSLMKFLSVYPEPNLTKFCLEIERKSSVIGLGVAFESVKDSKTPMPNKVPVILWNHRWEYDKNPIVFFEALFKLKSENIAFKLVVLGKSFSKSPEIFTIAKEHLKDEIIHWGYAENKTEYYSWLQQSDIIPVTSNQEFFGLSLVEAMYYNVYPLLPNRLVFPEHITQDETVFLYETNEEMYVKLKQFCLSPKVYNVRSFVLKYDWQEMIKQYDSFFESMLTK